MASTAVRSGIVDAGRDPFEEEREEGVPGGVRQRVQRCDRHADLPACGERPELDSEVLAAVRSRAVQGIGRQERRPAGDTGEAREIRDSDLGCLENEPVGWRQRPLRERVERV